MKQKNDTIQFESRAELGELIKMIERYLEAYPEEKDNEFIKDFYGKLDLMEMIW